MRGDTFLKAAEERRPAVVPGVDVPAGLAVVRRLGAAGVPVLALDADADSPGLRSRHAWGRVCPDPELDEQAFVDYLESLAATLPGCAVLLPADERYVATASRRLDHLRRWFRVPLSPWEVLRRLLDPTDLAALVAGGGADAASAVLAHADLAVFAAYLDAQSRPLAQFTGLSRRGRLAGSRHAAALESVWLPDLAETCLRLLRGVGFHGLCEVELRRPADDEGPPVRVRPCTAPWLTLAAACGVDLALSAYRDAIGEPYLTPRQAEGRHRGVMPSVSAALLDPAPEGVRLWRTLRGAPASPRS